MQVFADAALGMVGAQGTASDALVSPPVTGPDASSLAAPSPHHINCTEASLGSLDQPRAGVASQAEEPSRQPAVNLQLLRGQHQLEQVRMQRPNGVSSAANPQSQKLRPHNARALAPK